MALVRCAESTLPTSKASQETSLKYQMPCLCGGQVVACLPRYCKVVGSHLTASIQILLYPKSCSMPLRLCPHVGNFNFAIWRQRDTEMFFCQKNCKLKKMSSIPQQYFLTTAVNNVPII